MKRRPARLYHYGHATGAVAELPAPEGGSQDYSGAQSLCRSALPRSSANVATEPSAVQELAEMEQCGLRVVWPLQTKARAWCPAAPCEARPPCQATSSSAGPEVAPDVAEALRELAELQACGLRVAWPG